MTVTVFKHKMASGFSGLWQSSRSGGSQQYSSDGGSQQYSSDGESQQYSSDGGSDARDKAKANIEEVKDICVDKCPSHTSDVIVYFCNSCDQLACLECMITSHRQCEKVDYIPEVVKYIEQSEDFKVFTSTISNQSSSLSMHGTRYDANKNKSEMLKDNTKHAIKSSIQEVYRLIKKLENKIDGSAERIYHKDQERLSLVLDKINSLTNDLQQISTNIDEKRRAGLNCQLFVALKKAKQDTLTIERSLQELDDQNKVQNYHFELAPNIQQLTVQQEELGRLKKTSSETKKRIKFLFSIPLKSRNDRNKPEPAGMCLVSENCLLIVDIRNCSIKQYDINNKTLAYVSTFESQLWDVTNVSNKKVAVTFPYDGKVKFLEVSLDHVLTELKTIDVGKGCHGICYSDEKLYVSYCTDQSGYIKVLDLSGKMLKEITGHYNHEPLFQIPLFLDISPDKQSLYVSDAGNYRLTCMTVDGKVKAVAKTNESYYGLTVDVDGCVYVCNYHSFLDVKQLSEDCKLVQNLQIERKSYRAVVFCEKTNRLFFSCTDLCHDSEVSIYSTTV